MVSSGRINFNPDSKNPPYLGWIAFDQMITSERHKILFPLGYCYLIFFCTTINILIIIQSLGFPGSSVGKEVTCNVGERPPFDS